MVHYALHVLVFWAGSRLASSVSTTASVYSTLQDVATTTHKVQTDTSVEATAIATTFDETDTTIRDFTIENDTSTSDFASSTEADATTNELTTTSGTGIDFTTYYEIISSTTEFETSTGTDPTLTTIQYSSKVYTTKSDMDIEITTNESVSASTSDGTTSIASATTSTDVSSVKPDLLSTSTDSATTNADKTTTTDQASSTTTSVPSTSIDPGTTTAVATTTTDASHSSTLFSTPEVTTSSAEGQTTEQDNATATKVPVCLPADVAVKDDIKNNVIIALSVVLGIMSISIIIWCVMAKFNRNVRSYIRSNMVSVGTQTEDNSPKDFYFRSLPPVDTHMKPAPTISSPEHARIKFSSHENYKNGDIASEEDYPKDAKIDIFSDNKCEVCIELPRNGDCLPNQIQLPSDCDKMYNVTDSSSISVTSNSSYQTDTETLPTISDDIENCDENIEEMLLEDSSNVRPGSPCPDKTDTFSIISEVRSSPRDFDPIRNLVDLKTCKEIQLNESKKIAERLFVRTSFASNPDIADKSAVKEANVASAGMENKRLSFQIKHCGNEDEEVEEIIMLHSEKKVPTVRHVTFEDQNVVHTSSSIENNQSDNTVTIISPKFKRLVITKAERLENTPETQITNRKRKWSATKKIVYKDDDKSLQSRTQVLRRPRVTYNIIADAFFKPEHTEKKVWKHLKKLNRRKRLIEKVCVRNKKIVSQSQPEFQTEPYSSIYSKLSYFETL